MIRFLLYSMLLLVPHPDAPAQTFTMDALLWQKRPLLLFAPTSDTPDVRDFRAALQQAKAGFLDRDMVLIEAYRDDKAWLDGSRLPGGTAADLRERFRVAEGDTVVVLVGKDGGEKLRTTLFIKLERIFGLIDSMPMRRQEMGRRAYSSGAAPGG